MAERITYFQANIEELIALIRASPEHRERFDVLTDKATGKESPFRDVFTEAEWDELWGMI